MAGLDNTPGERERLALLALVEKVLDPLREALGEPIRITSGYRSPELNRLVGGVPTSQHLKGEAADCTAEAKRLFTRNVIFCMSLIGRTGKTEGN